MKILDILRKVDMMMFKLKRRITVFLSLVLLIALCVPSVQASGAFPAAQESATQEVNALIDRLENADGHIPEDFTKDEMDKFLAEADPKSVSEILNNIIENAAPVPMPSAATSGEAVQGRSETYVEYDPETGKESVHSFSEVYTENNVTEGIVIDSASNRSEFAVDRNMMENDTINLRAYPDYWSETSPQSYADTRSTCKIIVKTKAGYDDTVGSGYLVSDGTLLTASHCVYNPSYFGGWCDYLVIVPSYSASNSLGHYGFTTSGKIYMGNFYYIPTNYVGDDWAIVKLNHTYNIGGLSTISYGSSSHKNLWIRTQGYPDKNPQTGLANLDMYLTTGTGTRDYSDYYKSGNAKSYGGMSGGPVLTYYNSQYYAVGIISGNVSNNVHYVAFDTNLHNLIISHK